MKIASNMTKLIGNTPMIELTGIERRYELPAHLSAKLESMNPGGSAKDRIALKMICTAEAEGRLAPGGTVIEPTSGNTGIGIAAICASRGYKAIIVMPDNMSMERKKLIAAYGAQLVLTPASLGMAGAVNEAQRIHESTRGSIIAGQFENPANPQAHYETTGPEIWRDMDGKIDVFVAGVGSGGTLSGTGRYLKEQNPDIRIIAVEPAESPLLSKGVSGAHGIQGIGANFVPKNLDRALVDEVIDVPTVDAIATAREMMAYEGILCGISGGAALCAAIQIAKREDMKNKSVVFILPDTGERYVSSALFDLPQA